MSGDYPTRRRTRVREETFNREGHWTREFYARCEPWPVIEQWAGENDFHLVALRGKRRLYQKGSSSSFYRTLIDIKEREEGHHLVLSAWIESGFLPRLAHGFAHGRELPIEPSGWAGVWQRRAACRELNSLLGRFRQLPIVGSESLHLADIDPSTLLLAVLCLLPILVFLGYDGSKMEVGPALSNGLLISLGRRLMPLGGTAVVLLLAHHFWVLRRWGSWLAKGVSLGLGFGVFSLVSVILMTRTSSEMAAQKVSYHCIYRYDAVACRKALETTPPRLRENIASHLPELQQALSGLQGPVRNGVR